jgi:GPI mannosyltransferase 2
MEHPRRTISATSLGIKAATTLGLYLAHALPSFDSSSTTLQLAQLEPFVRWDTVYFLRIALNGYEHEQQAAFMPGLPGLMRLGAEAGRWGRGAGELEVADAVLSGMLASAVAGTVAALCLYR